MKKLNMAIIAFVMIITLGLTSGLSFAKDDLKSNEEAKSEVKENYTVKDFVGREISFDKVPESAIVMGHGVLKVYSYIMGSEKLVGIENAEIGENLLKGQSIHYAYPEIRDINIIGNGGSKLAPDYEQLSFQKPDVIFCAYNIPKEEYDAIEEKVQAPVVALDEGKSGSIFDEKAYENFKIIGEVMNKEKRAEELISFMENAKGELEKLSEKADDSPKIYMGGSSFKGEQGILSTKSHIDLFESVNAKNIMDDLTEDTSIIIDKEKLTELNPEMIILDLSGKTLIDEDYNANPDFYEHLDAFKNKKVYSLMPYFTYGMNYDTAIVDAYYLGSLAHPDEFKDIDLKEKAKEIYETFVGKDEYDNLKEYYPESFEEYVK